MEANAAGSSAGFPELSVGAAAVLGAHYGLARLEAAGRLRQLVTQNVDGLHQRAGSIDVIELHGNLRRVRCIDCGADHSRESIQRTLEAENSDFLGVRAMVAPDGDADVEPYWV